MRQVLQQMPDGAGFGRSGAALQRGALVHAPARKDGDAWDTVWPRQAESQASQASSASSPIATPTAWWAETDEGYALLQRMALSHLLVGVCVALALGWQVAQATGPSLTPAIGLIVAIGGTLALLLMRVDHPAMLLWARLALVAVDLCAAGGILWLRGGEGWTLLVLLPPVALAVAFFAERGGALATIFAAVMIVALNISRDTSPSEWMPSLLVFLGAAALVVAFLGIYSAQVAAYDQHLRWLLAEARSTSERLHADRHKLLVRLRAVEQAQEPLLRERARHADGAAELAMLALRLAQGDSTAAEALQVLRPGVYGPLAELASALARLSRTSGAVWNPSNVSAATALASLDVPIRAQGQALASLDSMVRALCVGANELVAEARSLEPGVSLIGSGQYTQALYQLEHRLRTQATHMALLGTQLADIRTSQENLESVLMRVAAGAKTPIFANSDVRSSHHMYSQSTPAHPAQVPGQYASPYARSLPGQYSGPETSFGASAVLPVRRAVVVRSDNAIVGFANDPRNGSVSDFGTVRWEDWRK